LKEEAAVSFKEKEMAAGLAAAAKERKTGVLPKVPFETASSGPTAAPTALEKPHAATPSIAKSEPSKQATVVKKAKAVLQEVPLFSPTLDRVVRQQLEATIAEHALPPPEEHAAPASVSRVAMPPPDRTAAAPVPAIEVGSRLSLAEQLVAADSDPQALEHLITDVDMGSFIKKGGAD
jgi:hypothetical protein